MNFSGNFLMIPFVENCQNCRNFKASDKIGAVIAKQTPDSCSLLQN